MSLLFRKTEEDRQNKFSADRDSYIRDVVAGAHFPNHLCDEAVKSWPAIRKQIVDSGVDQPTIFHLRPAVLEWAMSQLSDEGKYEQKIRMLSERDLLEEIYRKLYPRVTS